jgi:3'-phosphoadenosine 5'-phosphosulfate (PAPS) 3'-phosphatase
MADTNPSKLIHGMVQAALKAAHIALIRRKQGLNIRIKSDGSRVTSGDYQAQQIIEAELRSISQEHPLPDIKFLMEEHLNGMTPDFAGRNHGLHWVVDPIDGTIGYSRKLGETPAPWAISIALEKDGKTIAAVVYEAAENEYGTTPQDFASIAPETPSGKIFWAHKTVPHTHRLEGTFSVTPVNSNESYAQRIQTLASGYDLPILATIPELTVHYADAADTVLDKKIRVAPHAMPLIDDFYQDEGDQMKLQFCAQCGFIGKDGTKYYKDCFSAVVGAMHAADGRTGAYLSGKGFPWDHSAARLILVKSGTPCAEYRVGDGSEERSMLIAGRK